MNIAKGSILLLYQLADSAFPVGGFAYSNGLESAVKHSFVFDQESLRTYLYTYSQQILSFDFPFVSSSYHLSCYDTVAITYLSRSYLAMLCNPPIQKSGAMIGKNWQRIVQQMGSYAELQAMEQTLTSQGLALDFTVTYGQSMKVMGFSLVQTLELYYYMMIRDQISALIRLNVSGPTRAHEELRYFLETFGVQIQEYRHTDIAQAYKSAYLMEISQIMHDRIWSKLFQN